MTVQAGNKHGYGQKAQLTFTTNSTGKTGLTADLLDKSCIEELKLVSGQVYWLELTMTDYSLV